MTLKEMADETMFYMIRTRLAQKYVDIIKKKCNACGVCDMCMCASVVCIIENRKAKGGGAKPVP